MNKKEGKCEKLIIAWNLQKNLLGFGCFFFLLVLTVTCTILLLLDAKGNGMNSSKSAGEGVLDGGGDLVGVA